MKKLLLVALMLLSSVFCTGAEARNLAANGTFETGANGISMNVLNGGDIAISPIDPISGNQSLEITNPQADASWKKQVGFAMPIENGITYEVAFDVRLDESPGNSARIDFELQQNHGEFMALSDFFTADIGMGVTHVSKIFNATGGDSIAKFLIDFGTTGGTKFTLDNVVVTRFGETPNEFFELRVQNESSTKKLTVSIFSPDKRTALKKITVLPKNEVSVELEEGQYLATPKSGLPSFKSFFGKKNDVATISFSP